VTVSTVGLDVSGAVEWLRSWLIFVPAGLVPVALMLFPTGRLPSTRWRVPFALAIAGVSVMAFFLAVAATIAPDPFGVFGPTDSTPVENLLTVVRLAAIVSALSLVLAVVSLGARMRVATDFERRQVLCLLLGAIVFLLALGLDVAGAAGAWSVGAAALPVAAGVAILWHRLYDLDLFINRSLVYLGLSVMLLAAFAAIVVLGNQLASRVLPDGAWTLIAVALVALSLDPLRRRLQRSVDRLLYGNRDDPYAVVTALGRGLGAATEAPTMLTDVAEAVARSLALPYVAIEVLAQDGPPRVAAWGRRLHGEPIVLPLAYRGEEIGRLLVAPRTVRGRLSERDRGLLEDIAHPVALTVSAVEVSASLQRAREQLVTTREEERRRLRRDLHDGLGPTLAGMVMQLDAASNVLRRDPGAVEPLLAGLRVAAQDAVGDIRRLVYELRPPALDELGLIGAIQEWTDRVFHAHGEQGLTVAFDAPASLPAMPAAVEVAALRIVQEGLANVARHAHAGNCAITIAAADDRIVVDIEDDGRGLAGDHRPGVGLASMRERAAELGGTCAITSAPGAGTHVHASLPLAGQ
jgi:signal transduction histidine kinase